LLINQKLSTSAVGSDKFEWIFSADKLRQIELLSVIVGVLTGWMYMYTHLASLEKDVSTLGKEVSTLGKNLEKEVTTLGKNLEKLAFSMDRLSDIVSKNMSDTKSEVAYIKGRVDAQNTILMIKDKTSEEKKE
jgi:hypothetical protein